MQAQNTSWHTPKVTIKGQRYPIATSVVQRRQVSHEDIYDCSAQFFHIPTPTIWKVCAGSVVHKVTHFLQERQERKEKYFLAPIRKNQPFGKKSLPILTMVSALYWLQHLPYDLCYLDGPKGSDHYVNLSGWSRHFQSTPSTRLVLDTSKNAPQPCRFLFTFGLESPALEKIQQHLQLPAIPLFTLNTPLMKGKHEKITGEPIMSFNGFGAAGAQICQAFAELPQVVHKAQCKTVRQIYLYLPSFNPYALVLAAVIHGKGWFSHTTLITMRNGMIHEIPLNPLVL